MAGALPFSVRWVSWGYPSRRTPFDLPLGLLLLAGAIGAYFSPDRHLGLGAYQSLVILVTLYYSLANYEHPEALFRTGLPTGALAGLFIGGYVFLERPRALFPRFGRFKPSFIPRCFPGLKAGLAPHLRQKWEITIAIEVIIMVLVEVALFPGRKSLRICCGFSACFCWDC